MLKLTGLGLGLGLALRERPPALSEQDEGQPAPALVRVERLLGPADPTLERIPFELVPLELVPLEMTATDRRRVRRRLTAPDGLELGLALPTGTVLEPGAVLHATDTRAYVVTAALESVALVRPGNWAETARVAHAVGNLHRDIDPQPEGLLVLWDAPLELLLLRLGVQFERTLRPFLGRPSWEHP